MEAARAATRAEARRYHIEREPETVELQALFTQYISACKRSETKAVKLIERAGDSVYKELLTLHYLEGLSWEAVAFRMNYSAGHILRLHAAALENIKRGNG